MRRTAIVLIAMALGVSSCADEPQALTTTSPMAEPEASSSTEATTTTSSTSTSATTTTAAPPIYGTLFRSADEYPEATFVTMLGSGPGSCSALEDTACVIRHTVPAGREVVATVGLVNSDRSALLEDLDAAECEASLDSDALPSVVAHWSNPASVGDAYESRWNYPVGELTPGVHSVTLRCDFDPVDPDGWELSAEVESIAIELPDLVTEVLIAPTVEEFTDFTTFPASRWNHTDGQECPESTATCVGGWLVLGGAAGQTGAARVVGVGEFGTRLSATKTIGEGQAVLVTALYNSPDQPDSGQGLEFHLEDGTWQTPDFRRFGIALWGSNRITHNVFEGPQRLESAGLPGAEMLHGNPYGILLAVGEDGQVMYRVQAYGAGTDWPGRTSPQVWSGETATFLGGMGAGWAGRDWQFVMQASEGTTVLLFSYSLISFDGFAPTAGF